ncbi:hypothetical protein BGW42_004134 [Actinomortierella wolfii]|nr:hypothetical protein BGW42_004134 [Actinomortierella wolfii]
MDKLMGLAAQFDKDGLLQQFAGHNDDDKEAVQKSLNKVEAEGVREADESDIHKAKAAHDKVYNDDGDADDEELGKAAGVQAFKSYEEEEQRSGGGGGKDALVQMAIGEAMKMFGKSGGSSGGGDKSAIIQTAITTAMSLFMSKGGSGGSGGGMQAQLLALLAGAGAGGAGKKDGEEGGSSSGGNSSAKAALDMLGSVGGEKGQALAGVLGKFM